MNNHGLADVQIMHDLGILPVLCAMYLNSIYVYLYNIIRTVTISCVHTDPLHKQPSQ